MLGKSLQTRDRPETLFRVCRCAREHISCPRPMSMRVCLRRYPVAKIRSGMPASLPPLRSKFCTCLRRCRCGLSLWQDSAVLECCLSLWDCRPGLCTGVAVRGFTRRGPQRSGGKGSPDGAYLYAGPGRDLAGWEHRRH